jgi:hypothetical protein
LGRSWYLGRTLHQYKILEMNTSKHTIRIDENYGNVLQKDGKDTFCPFTAPLTIPMQSMGQMNFNVVRFPCSTSCPHACIMFPDDDNSVYSITCVGDRPQNFKLEKEVKEAKMVKLVTP